MTTELTTLPFHQRLWTSLRVLQPYTWKQVAVVARIEWKWKQWFGSTCVGASSWCWCWWPALQQAVVGNNQSYRSSSTKDVSMLTTSSFSWIIPTLWTTVWMGWGARGLWQTWWSVALFTWRSRQTTTDAVAMATLHERIQTNRAFMKRLYTVYLPLEQPIDVPQQEVVVLLPGFSVHHAAYAGMAARLADQGILVVTVSTEPVRVATAIRKQCLEQIQQQVQEGAPGTKFRWTLVGHSLGAFATTHLANEHDNIVMLASAPLPNLLRDIHRQSNRVLMVHVPDDPVVDMLVPPHVQPTLRQACDALLPFNVQTEILTRDSTHGGFADYSIGNAQPENAAVRSAQQELTVAMIVDFIRNHNKQ